MSSLEIEFDCVRHSLQRSICEPLSQCFADSAACLKRCCAPPATHYTFTTWQHEKSRRAHSPIRRPHLQSVDTIGGLTLKEWIESDDGPVGPVRRKLREKAAKLGGKVPETWYVPSYTDGGAGADDIISEPAKSPSPPLCRKPSLQPVFAISSCADTHDAPHVHSDGTADATAPAPANEVEARDPIEDAVVTALELAGEPQGSSPLDAAVVAALQAPPQSRPHSPPPPRTPSPPPHRPSSASSKEATVAAANPSTHTPPRGVTEAHGGGGATLVITRVRVYDVPDADAESGSDPYIALSILEWPSVLGAAPHARTSDARNAQHPRWDGPLVIRLPAPFSPEPQGITTTRPRDQQLHPVDAQPPPLRMRIALLDFDPGEADGDDELCVGEVRLDGWHGAVEWMPLPGVGEFTTSAISFIWQLMDGQKPELTTNPHPVGAQVGKKSKGGGKGGGKGAPAAAAGARQGLPKKARMGVSLSKRARAAVKPG